MEYEENIPVQCPTYILSKNKMTIINPCAPNIYYY